MRRVISLTIGLLVLAAANTACLIVPGNTSQINLVSSTTVNGWQYDFYRNSAYPCSINGYQTFVVGTKMGSSPTGSSPLWVWMHGGGVGYFDSTGTPQPDGSEMTENSAGSLQATLTNAGLSANVQADPAGFRMLAVSYCNRDIYSGTGQTDPNNPNKNTDGSAANHQRTPGHQGRRRLHRSQVPDVEVLLGRGERRIGWRVLCRLVATALWEPTGRRRR